MEHNVWKCKGSTNINGKQKDILSVFTKKLISVVKHRAQPAKKQQNSIRVCKIY